MASETLEPCPMCGRDDSENNAIQQAAVNVSSVKSAIGGRAYQVECVCGTRGPVMAGAEEAVTAWNRRAAVAELVEEIEALKKRGTEAVIAYHAAICSPKGVVPVDSLYDPVIAARMEEDAKRIRSRHQAGLGKGDERG